ncbi:hypothetical protein [Spirochaeta cellobiosiphila]|uniref:hypothetical protein n=1 Tax=Spirochaeta cellobiosiphila TaxID=504483 RepID=UPI00041A538C|nr:hypothetical protein [Spirochaeta cellobiosiphila]
MTNINIDHWKTNLLLLPDSTFFDIMRCYLGELQTPFNKHKMIQQIQSFLLQESVQDNIISMLNETDLKVLTVIAYHSKPSLNTMSLFFQSQLSFLEIHHQVINMEERLLIYSDDQGQYRLNPLLIDKIQPYLSINWLCSSTVAKPIYSQSVLLNDYFIFGFLTLIDGESPLKIDGTWKKKWLESLSHQLKTTNKVLIHLMDSCINSNWIKFDNGNITVNKQELLTIKDLSHQSRYYYYLSAGITENPTMEKVNNLQNFIQSLPTDRILDFEGIINLMHLFLEGIDVNKTLTCLLSYGILKEVANGYQLNSSYLIPNDENYPGSAIVEANLEMRLPPGLCFELISYVLDFAVIKNVDIMPLFEISKDKVLLALSRDCKIENIIENLKKLTEPLPLNPMIESTLLEWGNSYESIQIYEGIVLCITEDRLRLIENDPEIKNSILKRLGTGIFLMSSKNVNQWKKALEILSNQKQPIQRETAPKSVSGLTTMKAQQLKNPIEYSWQETSLPVNQYDSEYFSQYLKHQKIPSDKQRELESRLERRLILVPAQINEKAVKIVKREARGLDFQGKLSLINQSIKESRDILEFQMRLGRERFLFHAQRLRKVGTDYEITGVKLPGNEEVMYKLSEISLVRKVRSGLVYSL